MAAADAWQRMQKAAARMASQGTDNAPSFVILSASAFLALHARDSDGVQHDSSQARRWMRTHPSRAGQKGQDVQGNASHSRPTDQTEAKT